MQALFELKDGVKADLELPPSLVQGDESLLMLLVVEQVEMISEGRGPPTNESTKIKSGWGGNELSWADEQNTVQIC